MGRAAIRQAYRTGHGGIIIRAKTEIEEFNNGTRNRIVITELPYQVNKARLIESIAEMVKTKRLEGISDVHEESDRTGMRIVIDVKRDANAQVVLNSLFKHTQLQISNGINFLALSNGEPKVLNLKEMIEQYVAHQHEVVLRKTKYDLEKAEDKHHILLGLVIAQNNIDRVIEIIKKSADKQEAKITLMAEFDLSDKQANAILEMRLHRLTSLEVESLKNELDELSKYIAELKDIISSPARIGQIIKDDLTVISQKYGCERKTEISMDYDGDINVADLIEKEDVVISMTHFGYVKRIPVAEYRAQRRGGKGVTAHKTKEEDFVENMFVCNTHDDLMFFTNKGKVFTIKAFEVPEAQKTAKGRAIVNLLQVTEGEKVTAIIPVENLENGYLLLATKNGLIKKTDLKEFESIRKVGKICISLVDDDELISVALTQGNNEILVASHFGKCIRFAEEDIRPMGREAQGVRSIKLEENDHVTDMVVIKEGYDVLTVSENGFGKISDVSDYRLQARAGKGIKAGVFNKKTGNLVNLKLVAPDEDVMLIADNGVIIRVQANEISKIGRDTLGVRIMKFKDEAKVVCVATTAHEDDSEAVSVGEDASAE